MAKFSFDDALNKIKWHVWDRMWGSIGLACVMRHNMRVMVAHPDEEQRLLAAQDLADCISATSWTALSLAGDE